jgi:hypothetical protein
MALLGDVIWSLRDPYPPTRTLVLGRILGAMFLIGVASLYFVGQRFGVIPSLIAATSEDPAEQRALNKRNAEVKRLIAARQARAAAVQADDRADFAAQIARDAPSPPAATEAASAEEAVVVPPASAGE